MTQRLQVCLIPDRGTHLGCVFDPQPRHYGRQSINAYLLYLIFLSLPLSLKSMKKMFSGADTKIVEEQILAQNK